MKTKIRVVRVVTVSVILGLLISSGIAVYSYESSLDCVDDISELTYIAKERAKNNNNAPLQVDNLLYHPDKQQWCFRYEVD